MASASSSASRAAATTAATPISNNEQQQTMIVHMPIPTISGSLKDGEENPSYRSDDEHQ